LVEFFCFFFLLSKKKVPLPTNPRVAFTKKGKHRARRRVKAKRSEIDPEFSTIEFHSRIVLVEGERV
jgi:hypothetical protein